MRKVALLLVAAGAAGAIAAACSDDEARTSRSENDASVEGGGDASDAAVEIAPRHACVRPLAIESIEDLGAFSLPSLAVLSRDGVSGAEFRGKLLWTFGDTFLNKKNSIDQSSVLTATSGWSTKDNPLALEEPVDDAGLPAQFIPYTQAEREANTADAQNGWALWPAQGLDTGDEKLLVFFQRIKRTKGSGFDSVGVGTARVALGGTVAERNPSDLFSLPDGGAPEGGAPSLYGASALTVLDGYVFSYACSSLGFLNSGCRVGRAPTKRADDRSAWEFFDGTSWGPDLTRASVIIEHVGNVSISLNPYLGCYLAVSGALLDSRVILRSSERLESGWLGTDGVSASAAPDSGLLPPEKGSYAYLFTEQPTLRSADGRQIVISYSRPTAPFRGDVRLARITLK